MPSCELCGQSADSLKKVKIEGAVLKACDSCADMGTEVSTSSKKRKKKSRNRSRSRRNEKVLVNDYGTRVKEAREDEEISIKELADDLNEKESLISKIEKQDLKPDNSLAEKLSKRLGIKLYTTPGVSDYEQESGDTRKATMEDVADIKES
ncbi:MAG: multiprotein bridging factor aMBF1 [Candidatus Nanohaloarchaea archaeon]